MRLNKLVEFLNSHDTGARPTFRGVVGDGRLLVASLVSDPAGDCCEVTEAIAPTLEAAREWLGY